MSEMPFVCHSRSHSQKEETREIRRKTAMYLQTNNFLFCCRSETAAVASNLAQSLSSPTRNSILIVLGGRTKHLKHSESLFVKAVQIVKALKGHWKQDLQHLFLMSFQAPWCRHWTQDPQIQGSPGPPQIPHLPGSSEPRCPAVFSSWDLHGTLWEEEISSLHHLSWDPNCGGYKKKHSMT